jgi:superfamily II DNA helicase RecQ
MSFMLPAYCSPEGVTIVVVPLVALREDLHRRCQDSGIESHVWQGRGANRAATVVFVTPESAVTKGFQLFVNRLQARQQLDRIVVDECHTVLDSDRSFRPQMKEVGGMMRESGVQAVFLTATLAPQDEGEFYRRMGLSASRVRMFRARTTRGNIRYKAVTVDDEEAREAAVERAVTDGLRHYETGRVIVYSGLVEQAERLGTLLSCPVYHSKVDTAAGKARRMREWLEETRVIVRVRVRIGDRYPGHTVGSPRRRTAAVTRLRAGKRTRGARREQERSGDFPSPGRGRDKGGGDEGGV